ncbi:MAG: hypothetical protein AB1Z20_17335 [Desulfobacterales bacterium]
MIPKQKKKLSQVSKPTCDTFILGCLAVITTLSLVGLAGCNLNDSFSSTGSEEAVVSTRVDSNHISAGLNANMEKQPKRIVVTGEMGITMPRTGQPYGTVEDRESGELYNIYGNDMDLHKKLMEKLHKMFDPKKWPVDIRASGLLMAPDFIPGDLKNSICITDLNEVVQWP